MLGFDSRRGLGIFLFNAASRRALGPTQPPIQWVPGAPSLGVKRPDREADHSFPSSAEVKECVEHISTPPILLHGVVLSLKKKHRVNFTFYLYLSRTSGNGPLSPPSFCNCYDMEETLENVIKGKGKVVPVL
jgi:hypothetical protein